MIDLMRTDVFTHRLEKNASRDIRPNPNITLPEELTARSRYIMLLKSMEGKQKRWPRDYTVAMFHTVSPPSYINLQNPLHTKVEIAYTHISVNYSILLTAK